MKQRLIALLTAASLLLTLALLPARALADFQSSGYCPDGDCTVNNCTGPADPNHRARGPADVKNMSLNLSSEGQNAVLSIPVKPDMTLNGITWLPDYGYKGNALINVKALQAAQLGGTLLDNVPTLNINNLLIARNRLYVSQDQVINVLRATGQGTIAPNYNAFPKRWINAFNNPTDEQAAAFQALSEQEWDCNCTRGIQGGNPFSLKGQEFVIAVGGKTVGGNLEVDNVWQDQEVPFFDPAYANCPPNQGTTCPGCRGNGVVEVAGQQQPVQCPTCNGAGVV